MHVNRRLERLLSEEPERESLEQVIEAVAGAVVALVERAPRSGDPPQNCGERRVVTSRGTYRVGAIHGGEALLHPGSVLVCMEPLFRVPLSGAELRERYALTRREIEVARLLAAGRSNLEVAQALRISPHTARHHTESVMAKLDVRSRTRIRDRITR